ncbi:MAG: CRISPR-associated endonuclease Cas2 [Methylococcales bacterium]|nr:CRISPR-associated endonuclease Cas2 [Methylococcales bacterium]
MHPLKYLVCYDICNPRRLRRVHRSVRDWGIPIQFSVFEVELNQRQLAIFMKQLQQIIHSDEDKVLLYRLNHNQAFINLGTAVQRDDLLFL